MMRNISLRTSEKIMKEAEKLAKLEYVDKSIVLREALERGLEDIKLEVAIKLFVKGKISTSEAANIADISVGEMMDEFVKRGIKPDITEKDLMGSLEMALKELK